VKRAIKERHEILVPCALSPTGEHRVWFDCGADRAVVRLVSECRREGDAALRLGAASCLSVVLAARHEITTKQDIGGKQTEPHGAIPESVRANVWSASYDAARKRKERARRPRDERPLLVRLIERRARRLSPEFGTERLVASVAVDGTRNLHATRNSWGGGLGSIVAQKRMAYWTVDERALANVAKHIGKGNGSVCLICKGDEAYADFGSHGRAKAHQAGVLAVLRRVCAKLPGGVR